MTRRGPKRAFELDVLALVGSPDEGYMTHLYEKHEKLPLFARALLAHAMILARGPSARTEIDELLRDVENHLRVSAVGADGRRERRLRVLGPDGLGGVGNRHRGCAPLVAADPNHPLAARIAKGLMALRKKGRVEVDRRERVGAARAGCLPAGAGGKTHPTSKRTSRSA